MAVAPDLLLQTAPPAKPRKAQAKVPAETPQARKNEPSSFAQVYAKERQNKPVERAEGAARPARDKSETEPAAAVASLAPTAEAVSVAESGKGLPVAESIEGEEVHEAGALDPLLLLGITGQLPVSPQETALALAGAAEQAQDAVQQSLLASSPGSVAGLVSPAQAAMSEASHDPLVDMLNTVPGVRLALELGAQGQVAAQQAAMAPGALASALNNDSAQAFAGTLAALTEQAAGEADAGLEVGDLELSFMEAGASMKDAGNQLNSDNLAGRLSALSQAVAQQTSASGRATLIPGQPLAMQQGGWSEAVVDKVMWLSSQNLKSAEIQLDPAELGRLEVRVDISKEQTQVTFASPHAGVRDALEGQVQRLRDLFTQQGMNLLDVNVSDQSLSRGWQGQGQGQEGEGQRQADSAAGLAAVDEEKPLAVGEVRSNVQQGARRLVDYYA